MYDHQIFSSQIQGGVSRYFAELLVPDPFSDVRAMRGWTVSPNRHWAETAPLEALDWLPSFPFKGKAHLTAWWNRGISIRALKSSGWDLFHPTYYHPYFVPLLNGRPFILTIHDMTHELYPQGLSDSRVTPGHKALLARLASAVIAVSENTRQDAIRLLGLPADKVVTIPHGNSLVPARVRPMAPAFREPYWLYVGHRGGYKNWNRLVEALAERRSDYDHLVMVGGGVLSEEERVKLAMAGLTGRWLQVSASESELAGWYQGAKALIYPSLYEGFGLPLVEAMAWDCPVVAARASSLPEVAEDAALWFDPNSTADLVAALDAVSDQSLRRALVEKGRKRQAVFTWGETRRRTHEVYRQVGELRS